MQEAAEVFLSFNGVSPTPPRLIVRSNRPRHAEPETATGSGSDPPDAQHAYHVAGIQTPVVVDVRSVLTRHVLFQKQLAQDYDGVGYVQSPVGVCVAALEGLSRCGWSQATSSRNGRARLHTRGYPRIRSGGSLLPLLREALDRTGRRPRSCTEWGTAAVASLVQLAHRKPPGPAGSSPSEDVQTPRRRTRPGEPHLERPHSHHDLTQPVARKSPDLGTVPDALPARSRGDWHGVPRP